MFTKKIFGIDSDELSNAEQSFITAMNDCSLKDKVMRSILSKTKNPLTFLGSFFVCRDDIINDMRKIQSDVITVNNMATKLKKVKKGKTYVFTCGGCIFRPSSDISHHLAFIWTPGKSIIGFNPGIICYSSEMADMVEESVLKGTNLNIEWDLICGKYGPQDYTRSIFPCKDSLIPPFFFRADSFCQTWVIYWVYNYLNGNSCAKWTKLSFGLTTSIRKFIMWIVDTFPEIRNCSEYEYSHTNINDFREQLVKGYNMKNGKLQICM